VLDVAIRADGSLQEVRVVRSSGYPELDQAAQRIVRLGAPYAPFPSSLRRKYGVLQIARTLALRCRWPGSITLMLVRRAGFGTMEVDGQAL
jgi:TonB family protein